MKTIFAVVLSALIPAMASAQGGGKDDKPGFRPLPMVLKTDAVRSATPDRQPPSRQRTQSAGEFAKSR